MPLSDFHVVADFGSPLKNGMYSIKVYGTKPAEQREIIKNASPALMAGIVAAIVSMTMAAVTTTAKPTFTPASTVSTIKSYAKLAGVPSTPVLPEAMTGQPSTPALAKSAAGFEGMSKEDIYHALLARGEEFKAIAVLLEDVRTKVYYDGGGRNIGMGYCLSKQISTKGRIAVVNELRSAGIPAHKAMILTDLKSTNPDVEISVEQAFNLLDITQKEYEDYARRWLGAAHFDALNDHQRASVSYLAYNVGYTNLRKFKVLRAAILHEKPSLVKKHMKVNFQDRHGKMRENVRASTVLASTFLTPETAAFIPANLHKMEEKRRNKENCNEPSST